jgi:hypothetical protein
MAKCDVTISSNGQTRRLVEDLTRREAETLARAVAGAIDHTYRQCKHETRIEITSNSPLQFEVKDFASGFLLTKIGVVSYD